GRVSRYPGVYKQRVSICGQLLTTASHRDACFAHDVGRPEPIETEVSPNPNVAFSVLKDRHGAIGSEACLRVELVEGCGSARDRTQAHNTISGRRAPHRAIAVDDGRVGAKTWRHRYAQHRWRHPSRALLREIGQWVEPKRVLVCGPKPPIGRARQSDDS